MTIMDRSLCVWLACTLTVFMGSLTRGTALAGESFLADVGVQVALIHQETTDLNRRTQAVRLDLESGDLRRQSPVTFSRRSANFIVFGPADNRLVADVLESAERLRRDLAVLWFGDELPDGRQPTIIEVTLTGDVDQGLTWYGASGTGSCHRVWLSTNRDRATGSTLAHELTHVLMHERFPQGMPAWANEGVASLQDDAARHERQCLYLEEFVRAGRWPSLARMLDTRAIDPADEALYAVSKSLTRYLLTRANRQTFLTFVDDGSAHGWTSALRTHYAIGSSAELQQLWQDWVLTSGER